MNPAYLSALAALAGSAIGGLTSFAAAWITQRQQAHVEWLLRDKGIRQELYKQFVQEGSKLYADALVHDQLDIPALVSLYALISRMRITSNPEIVGRADKVIRMIVSTYFSPNKTPSELRDMIGTEALDPLRAFSEACREE